MGKGSSLGNIFGVYKTKHIFAIQQCKRTGRQTDGWTYCYVSKFSFVERTFTVQLPRDGGATCRIGMYVQRRLFQCESDCRSLCVQISREWSYPLPIYWHHSKGNWLRYNFAAESFYIMKLCSRLFVLYCRNCPKDDKFRYFISILGKLGEA